MPTLLQQIREVDRELKQFGKKEQNHWREKRKVESRRASLSVKYALHEGLKEVVWDVIFEKLPIGKCRFDLAASLEDFPKLKDIILNGYHSKTELAKGANLYINDGRVDLIFERPEMAQIFIQKYGIRLNMANVKETAAKIAQELANLNEFIDTNGG